MNREDLSIIFEQYGPMVYRRARYLLGSHEDAEEACQEVFVKALKHAESFRHKSQVSTWLYRITTNYCLNAIRNRRTRMDLWNRHVADREEHPPLAPDPHEMVLLRRLLAGADEATSKAAVYVYLDGMSHKEAARLLGVSRRTVGNRLNRFKQQAAAMVDPDPEEAFQKDSAGKALPRVKLNRKGGEKKHGSSGS